MPSPERKLEAQLVAFCKKHGIYCRKWVSPGHRGVPDRILMYKEEILFLELKSPGEKVEPLQELEHRAIRKQGFEVHTVDHWTSIQRHMGQVLGFYQ